MCQLSGAQTNEGYDDDVSEGQVERPEVENRTIRMFEDASTGPNEAIVEISTGPRGRSDVAWEWEWEWWGRR